MARTDDPAFSSFFDHSDADDSCSIMSDCSSCSYAADLLPKSRPRRGARPAGRWASAIKRMFRVSRPDDAFSKVPGEDDKASAAKSSSSSTSTSTTSLASMSAAVSSSSSSSGAASQGSAEQPLEERGSTRRRWSQFSMSR